MDLDDLVTIVCSDEEIQTNRLALKPYRSLLEARSQFAGSSNRIGLTHLPSSVVRQIVSWAERHMNDPSRPVFDSSTQNTTVSLTPEDQDHLQNLDVMTLFAVIQASDELILLDLLDAACQAAAKVLEKADPIELRHQFFDGESGFTEEEEDELRKENEWIEEL